MRRFSKNFSPQSSRTFATFSWWRAGFQSSALNGGAGSGIALPLAALDLWYTHDLGLLKPYFTVRCRWLALIQRVPTFRRYVLNPNLGIRGVEMSHILTQD